MDPVILLAPTAAEAARASKALSARRAGLCLRPYSLGGFLRFRRPPSAVVLYAGEKGLAESLEFLRRIRRRLLWPRPEEGLFGAISGLISREDPPADFTPRRRSRPPRHRTSPAPMSGELTSALLLEGDVTAERARAALASDLPRDWIVETPLRARLSESDLEDFRESGGRWRALDPIVVLALAASPAFARARARWQPLLPAGTPVWTLSPKLPGSRRRTSRSHGPSD